MKNLSPDNKETLDYENNSGMNTYEQIMEPSPVTNNLTRSAREDHPC